MDAGELTNFLNSRGARSECPVCGHDGKWARVEADDDLKLQTSDGLGMLRVAALICQNCCFVRLHALDAFWDLPMDGNEDVRE